MVVLVNGQADDHFDPAAWRAFFRDNFILMTTATHGAVTVTAQSDRLTVSGFGSGETRRLKPLDGPGRDAFAKRYSGIRFQRRRRRYSRPRSLTAADVSQSSIGRYVSVTGRLVQPRELRKGHLAATFKDDSGRLGVFIPVYVMRRLRRGPWCERGARVRLQGKVGEFRGQKQINVRHSKGISILGPLKTGRDGFDLDRLEKGDTVDRRFTVRQVQERGGHLIVTVIADKQEVTVFIHRRHVTDSLRQSITPDVSIGEIFRVQVYRGKKQLVPDMERFDARE